MLIVHQFLSKNGLSPVPHLPYSPKFALSNFFLFPRMNEVLKEKRFADMEEVRQKTAGALKGIKIDELKIVEQWEKSLNRCIASNRECFEDD